MHTTRASLLVLVSTASLTAACPDPVPDAPDTGLRDTGLVDAYAPSFRDCACGILDAPLPPDANSDAPFVDDDAYTDPDAYSSPDAPLDAYVEPDAGTPACAPPAPLGAASGGLTLEGCTLLGLPEGFEVIDPPGGSNGMHGVTVGDDGRVWVTLQSLFGSTGDRIFSFVPEPGPGCRLRYTRVPLTGVNPGPLDVTADGTLYVLSDGVTVDGSGARSAHWLGGRTGSCPMRALPGTYLFDMDAMEDGRLLFGTWTPGMNTSAVVLDTRTCAFTSLPMRTTEYTRYAARLGEDIAVDGDRDGCGVQRVDGASLAREFCGPEGFTPEFGARCGDDVCVFASGLAQARRYSGVDGHEVANLATVIAPLPTAAGAIMMDGSPDGRTLVFAATSRCASGPYGLVLWRLTGF